MSALNPLSPLHSPGITSLNESMYTCESGEYIQRPFVCDGSSDCGDETDELYCKGK